MSAALAGKVALITGSSRGIGAAIARRFHAEGARVVVTWNTSKAPARALADELDAPSMRLDVTDRGSVRAAIETTLERRGGLDVLVNNAGILEQKPFDEISEADWDATLDVNLKGVFLCTQEVARVFRARGTGGSVVNVSSVGGQLGGPKAPHYAAAKAAVIAFTRSSARLLAPDGVRVNAIAPGFIRTDMYEHCLAGADESAVLAQIPLGRVGEPDEVARAVTYLASDQASFVTGHVLNVNGGQLMG